MIDFEVMFSKAIRESEKAGMDYADKKALSWHLQELKKSILDAAMLQEDSSKPLRIREAKARTSEMYKTHLEATKQAIKDELTSKAVLEKWRFAFERLRSLSSQETAKIKLQ